MGRLDVKNTIENGKNIDGSAAETDHLTAGISRSDLLLLLNVFHERLDGFFEEIRTLPQTTARLESAIRRAGENDCQARPWADRSR